MKNESVGAEKVTSHFPTTYYRENEREREREKERERRREFGFRFGF